MASPLCVCARGTDFRTWVSGVKAKHLKDALPLKEVRGRHSCWVLVGSGRQG